MVAALSKKRKLSQSDAEDELKKKSPLFNQPQNYYAPQSISSMSKDELSEWRKEQRRKRNRESAAASRNKTRARIEELEGEVDKWRSMYADMQMKMQCMERHIQFLTKLNSSPQVKLGGAALAPPSLAPSPPPVVSHPNSPPRSPQLSSMPTVLIPNTVTSSMPPPPAYSSHVVPANNTANLFPSLLSEPKDCTLVEKQEATAAATLMSTNEESTKHLTSISRQA